MVQASTQWLSPSSVPSLPKVREENSAAEKRPLAVPLLLSKTETAINRLEKKGDNLPMHSGWGLRDEEG